MSDGFTDETIDEVLDAIRALDQRVKHCERKIAELLLAASDNDLLDLDEDED